MECLVNTTFSSLVSPGNSAQVCLPKIAVLLGAPLSAQNMKRMGVEYLSPHANIILFDCKTWLGRPEDGLHYERATWDHLVTIGTAQDFEMALRQYLPDYALDFIGVCSLMPVIQASLARADVRLVVQKSGNLPMASLWSKVVWKLKSRPQQLVKTGSSKGLVSDKANGSFLLQIIWRMLSRWTLRLSLRSPDLALLAGSASVDYFTRNSREIIWVGSNDYHTFKGLPANKGDEIPKVPYAVFVDDSLPYASDWTILGMSAPVTAQCYYPAMRRLFDAIEAFWGMPVVVAAHPSSKLDERVKLGFRGRVLIHGQTADLVRNARAVLLHGSTAMSFAVLAEKPILFLTSEELASSSYGLHVKTMSAELGQVPLNIDYQTNIPDLPSLTPKLPLYSRYVDRYLCRKGTTESQPWQSFIKHISKTRRLDLQKSK